MYCPHCCKPIEAKTIYSLITSKAGKVKSEKKAKSSRENGKKGGRPKKVSV